MNKSFNSLYRANSQTPIDADDARISDYYTVKKVHSFLHKSIFASVEQPLK